jgi:GNAT superfamily N-acetyltransferase
MTIRPVTPADLPRCVEMARKFHAFAGLDSIAPFCARSTEATGRAIAEHGVFLVAEDDAEVFGMIGLMLAPVAHNHAYAQAVEAMWWVEPDERARGAGASLMDAAESAAKARGATSIMMIHLHNSPAAARAMYEARGYHELETVLVKAL